MDSKRLEAFTDGVIAIIITVMVLELRVPAGDMLSDLGQRVPILLAYVFSFINVGLYWNNHHHLFKLKPRIDGRVLWSNLFLLFWLSLVPFVIRWLDESEYAVGPTAAYGIVLGMAAVGYWMIERSLILCNGTDSALAQILVSDLKGWGTLAIYVAAVPLAFWSRPAAILLYLVVILIWFVPDRRFARVVDG